MHLYFLYNSLTTKKKKLKYLDKYTGKSVITELFCEIPESFSSGTKTLYVFFLFIFCIKKICSVENWKFAF